jgi:hypothetical protein
MPLPRRVTVQSFAAIESKRTWVSLKIEHLNNVLKRKATPTGVTGVSSKAQSFCSVTLPHYKEGRRAHAQRQTPTPDLGTPAQEPPVAAAIAAHMIK